MNIWKLLFKEVLVGINLKFDINPSSKRQVEKNVETESRYIKNIFGTMKKVVTF